MVLRVDQSHESSFTRVFVALALLPSRNVKYESASNYAGSQKDTTGCTLHSSALAPTLYKYCTVL